MNSEAAKAPLPPEDLVYTARANDSLQHGINYYYPAVQNSEFSGDTVLYGAHSDFPSTMKERPS